MDDQSDLEVRHPAVDRAKVQEQGERAVDCAEDERLFDIDIGY
jgi:hypothetical protein